jgi:alpha-glucosidase
MIRIEWAEDAVFEDRPTLAVVNRLTPPVKFVRKIKGDTLELRTAALTLKYRNDGAAPSKKNLAVSFSLDGRKVAWFPGKQDPQNLRGTARTLDGSKSHHSELGAGLISRSGWALVDDSTNIVIDGRGEGAWAAPRNKAKRCDLYFLAYGRDYRRALRDAAMIFGRQPLPPLFTLGYWWSRYWAYTDREFEQLVESFDKMKIPIDVLVVDMDWHLEGWTGYTWDRRYFPDPVDFLKRMKSRGLKITLNLHPAQGVGRHEEQFARMTRALGLHPARTKHIPFDCADPKYMRAYFAHLHHPHEKNGVDFWWLDWQQGRESRIEGLDPLPWLNRLHWEDMERRSRSARPLIFSRFGGIGSGRYPIGFSGDTYSIWESLQYQPYFTATASNALYGYWSHDIGGHAPRTISR